MVCAERFLFSACLMEGVEEDVDINGGRGCTCQRVMSSDGIKGLE